MPPNAGSVDHRRRVNKWTRPPDEYEVSSKQRWWRRDIRPGYVLLALLALLAVAYGGARWAGRHDAENERREFAASVARFTIPGSPSRSSPAVEERSCPQGTPRRAIRTENSTLAVDAVVADLDSQAKTFGWTSDPPGLAYSGGMDSSSPYLKGLELRLFMDGQVLEVWVQHRNGEANVRLIVSAGVRGLDGCY